MVEKKLQEIFLLFPAQVRLALQEFPMQFQDRIEEIRLRTGWPPGITVGNREYLSENDFVLNENDLQSVVDLVSGYSAHTIMDQLSGGYISVKGGHRLGLCGQAITEKGNLIGFRKLSSLNLRIAREVKGIARSVIPGILDCGQVRNTLIIAPPGAGKTTLLRDLIRSISDGVDGVERKRVGVADERGELAAIWEGIPQFELGRQTDVIEGVKKGEGLLYLLRSMNPQVLAVDEITHPTDLEAIFCAAGCGVSLLATAHGKSIEEMRMRPLYRELLCQGLFSKAVFITQNEGGTDNKVGGNTMLRLIGGTLLLGASIMIGFGAAEKLKERVYELDGLIASIKTIELELMTRKTPLQDMMRRVAEQTKGKVSKFYALCELGLEGGASESFASMWKEALLAAELHINQRERMILQNVGNTLGRYDANSQCSVLLTAREGLLSALDEAKELNDRMGKVYRTLGITAGAIFVIVAL